MSSVRDLADQDTLHSGPSALEVRLQHHALTLLAIADCTGNHVDLRADWSVFIAAQRSSLQLRYLHCSSDNLQLVILLHCCLAVVAAAVALSSTEVMSRQSDRA